MNYLCCECHNGRSWGRGVWNFRRVEAYDYTRMSLGFTGHLRQYVYSFCFFVSAAAYTLHLLGWNQAIEHIYTETTCFLADQRVSERLYFLYFCDEQIS